MTTLLSLLSSCVFQTRGWGNPPRDLPAVHPASVLSGNVHHRNAEICLHAGILTAPHERFDTNIFAPKQ